MRIANPVTPSRSAIGRTLIAAAAAGLLLAGCAGPVRPDGADALRRELTSLQSDPNLGSRAPVALQEADEAVKDAERETDDEALGQQRVYIARRKIDVARAQAERAYAESQVEGLNQQRERDRLASRTAEAEAAKGQAEAATAAALAEQRAAELARNQAMTAQQQAEAARNAANTSQQQADAARAEAEALKAQMADLQAQQTARGYVITLGDVLFATGKAELTAGATARLSKLADFMQKNPKQRLTIEGHTDSVGSAENNQVLSQRRAESVRSFLTGAGIDGSRVSAVGKGEDVPVADNNTASGKQQNRRVEVIINN